MSIEIEGASICNPGSNPPLLLDDSSLESIETFSVFAVGEATAGFEAFEGDELLSFAGEALVTSDTTLETVLVIEVKPPCVSTGALGVFEELGTLEELEAAGASLDGVTTSVTFSVTCVTVSNKPASALVGNII
ncbi:hypothetical protein [Paenibacillus sp. FSL H8-0034]|uniref:hypothetical protein n=1 Tax=Paenibacillus sp. FSL H8-0034 TaxID=2954671 RepID=UPI0030F9A4DB